MNFRNLTHLPPSCPFSPPLPPSIFAETAIMTNKKKSFKKLPCEEQNSSSTENENEMKTGAPVEPIPTDRKPQGDGSMADKKDKEQKDEASKGEKKKNIYMKPLGPELSQMENEKKKDDDQANRKPARS